MNTRGIFGMMILSVALASVPPAFAQDNYVATPVSVSKEKVKVNGRLCYSHVVMERQTLFSISKAYGVSIEDIYKYNPDVKAKGLKKNSIIVIPMPEEQDKPSKAGKKGRNEESMAKVETAQTSLAQKQEEKVTATATKDEGQEPEKKAEPKIHIVKWYETIETIAAKYDVEVSDIMKANGLKDKELKSRQKLVIPEKSATEAHNVSGYEPAQSAEAKDSEKAVEEIATEVDADRDAYSEKAVTFSSKKKVNLAIVMPFMAGTAKPSSSSIDFYCGALLAARDLGNDGTDINIDVYDVEDQSRSITAGIVSDLDFVVGPLSPNDIRRTYTAIGSDIVLISPLDPKGVELTEEYPKLIQVPTPHDFQYADLAQWIADESKPGDRTILVTEKGARSSDAMTSLVNMIDLSGLKYTTVSYSLLEGRDIIGSLKKATEEGAEHANRFIIASESEAFVNDVFRNISLLSRENRRVEIFCHSKVRGYDIEVESLHNNDLHVSLAYYIDYNSPDVIRFVKQYRALFNTEPTQFSFQGYDIVKYFSSLCAEYGDSWFNALGNVKKTMLQTTFDFRDGSRINEGVRRIEYEPDYQIKLVE